MASGDAMRIALLEDEPRDADLIGTLMRSVGHECRVFPTARSLMRGLPREDFSLLLMDWELPDVGGDRVLRWVRERIGWSLPVIFVTARDATDDIIAMLDAGADDYIVKPFNVKEMLARMSALVRRARPAVGGSERVEVGPFVIEQTEHRITRDGEEIELTPKELKLALALFMNLGRMLPRANLLRSIWGYGPEVATRTIDIHISRLRRKLDLQPDRGFKLTSVYDRGYRLDRVAADDEG